jgi:hypothetical protein
MTGEQHKKIMESISIICNYCENDECDKCIVTRLMSDANDEYEDTPRNTAEFVGAVRLPIETNDIDEAEDVFFKKLHEAGFDNLEGDFNLLDKDGEEI